MATTAARRLLAELVRALPASACLAPASVAAALVVGAAHAAPNQAPPPTSAASAPASSASAAAPPSPPAPVHPPPAATSPPPSQGAPEEQRRIERAKSLHDEARRLYQQGEYRAAIVKLEAALELDPEGKELVYNLAVIYERLGEIDTAERLYRRYLEMETDPKARGHVEGVLTRLQGAKKELSKPPPSSPPPAPVLPPARPVIREARECRPRPLAPSVLISGGVAAGAFVIGNVFAAVALATDPGASANGEHYVSLTKLEAETQTAHRAAVIAEVSLLAAGLAGGAALYFYVTTPPVAQPARPPTSPRTPPRPQPASDAPLDAARRAPPVALSLGPLGTQIEVHF